MLITDKNTFIIYLSSPSVNYDLLTNFNFIESIFLFRYIELFQDDVTSKLSTNTVSNRKAYELLGEHGRLFIRNLPFIVNESDIEDLFSQYGPISEMHLPIDPTTHNSVGYGYVTYMFSEHAYKALIELDASILQGRIIHILPAEPRETINNNIGNELFEDETNYKAKKKKHMKQNATCTNNWNSLFLGNNSILQYYSNNLNSVRACLELSSLGTCNC